MLGNLLVRPGDAGEVDDDLFREGAEVERVDTLFIDARELDDHVGFVAGVDGVGEHVGVLLFLADHDVIAQLATDGVGPAADADDNRVADQVVAVDDVGGADGMRRVIAVGQFDQLDVAEIEIVTVGGQRDAVGAVGEKLDSREIDAGLTDRQHVAGRLVDGVELRRGDVAFDRVEVAGDRIEIESGDIAVDGLAEGDFLEYAVVPFVDDREDAVLSFDDVEIAGQVEGDAGRVQGGIHGEHIADGGSGAGAGVDGVEFEVQAVHPHGVEPAGDRVEVEVALEGLHAGAADESGCAGVRIDGDQLTGIVLGQCIQQVIDW